MKPILNYVDLYLSSKPLRKRTREAYRKRLSSLTGFLKERNIPTLQAVKREDIAAYAKSLKHLSRATRAAYLRTVKVFFAHLAGARVILTDPAASLSIPQTHPLSPFPLTLQEMVQLLQAPNLWTLLGLRDRALLETLYATGMRAGECAHLRLREVDLAESLLFIATGKGGRGRWVPLTESAILYLRLYVERSRPALAKGRNLPFLFVTRTGRRIQVQDIRTICRHCGERAGIKRRVHPHLIRHTAACHLLENGASIRHIQILLGHRKLTTTQLYTKAPIGRLKRVLHRCHPRP